MSIDRIIKSGGFLLLALTFAACGDAEAGAGEGEEPFVRIINVETREVRPRPFVEQIRLTGTVKANQDVTISAQESGAVEEIVVDKGSAVQAGDALIRLDDRILSSQVAEARAQASLAEETWDRRRRLWEEDQVGSELAYLEARSNAEQARARLENLEERLRRTVIRAPITGMLEERHVEVGTLLSPGTPVARIVALNPVKVQGGVPERYAADVSRGAKATVTFDVLADQRFEGTMSYVGSTVNTSSRTFPVEFTLPNPGGAIKPEMVANIAVERRVIDDAIVVPQQALVRIAEGFVVFVVEGEGAEATANRRQVEVETSQQNQVVIRSGLDAGERLVVVGQNQVADGDRVRVVQEANQ
jgi:RND family efflux transporter MFP subunit